MSAGDAIVLGLLAVSIIPIVIDMFSAARAAPDAPPADLADRWTPRQQHMGGDESGGAHDVVRRHEPPPAPIEIPRMPPYVIDPEADRTEPIRTPDQADRTQPLDAMLVESVWLSSGDRRVAPTRLGGES